MGTRADFYVGRGTDAEWIGSYAFDGHPVSLTPGILAATNEHEYRQAVTTELAGRDDATTPDQGWPWPWNDSNTTDYAYTYDDGRLWGSSTPMPWFAVDPEADCFGEPDWIPGMPNLDFPDMSTRKNVRYDKGSGLIILSTGGTSSTAEIR